MHWLLFLGSVAAEFLPQDETISGYADRDATYVLERIDGRPVAATATIRFPAKGRVTGDGPCNGYAASQTQPYPWISIEAIVSSRAACPDLRFETAFFAALREVTIAEVAGPVLILSEPGGTELSFRARR